jgi:hypothetical protein
MKQGYSASSKRHAVRRLTLIPLVILLTSLASLTACQTAPQEPPAVCSPTPPRLNWTKNSDGGVTLSPTAVAELMNYIHDLQDCAVN